MMIEPQSSLVPRAHQERSLNAEPGLSPVYHRYANKNNNKKQTNNNQSTWGKLVLPDAFL